MAIEFLKDHCGFIKGDVVDNHPNSSYLIILGVAKQKGGNKVATKKDEDVKVINSNKNKVK